MTADQRLADATSPDFRMWEQEMSEDVPQEAIRYMEGEGR